MSNFPFPLYHLNMRLSLLTGQVLSISKIPTNYLTWTRELSLPTSGHLPPQLLPQRPNLIPELVYYILLPFACLAVGWLPENTWNPRWICTLMKEIYHLIDGCLISSNFSTLWVSCQEGYFFYGYIKQRWIWKLRHHDWMISMILVEYLFSFFAMNHVRWFMAP